MNTLVKDLIKGAQIEWEGRQWTVRDVRWHAMSDIDNTVWLILEGWKEAGMGDPPKVDQDTEVPVNATFF